MVSSLDVTPTLVPAFRALVLSPTAGVSSGASANEPSLMSPHGPMAHIGQGDYSADPVNSAEYKDNDDIHLSPPRFPTPTEPLATFFLTTASEEYAFTDPSP
jgi:hypothetical protein